MELKYTSDRQFRYDIYCFNRTFMELKWEQTPWYHNPEKF